MPPSASRSSPRRAPCMRRDLLLLGEMIAAADRIQELVSGVTVEELAGDR